MFSHVASRLDAFSWTRRFYHRKHLTFLFSQFLLPLDLSRKKDSFLQFQGSMNVPSWQAKKERSLVNESLLRTHPFIAVVFQFSTR